MTQHNIYSTILLCLVFSLNTTFASNFPNQSGLTAPNTEHTQLTLVGIVLDAYNTPLQNATIELIEVNSSEEAKFITPENGQFYFNLLPDTKYTIRLLSAENRILARKEVSTINKLTSEVLHIVLQASDNKDKNIVHR